MRTLGELGTFLRDQNCGVLWGCIEIDEMWLGLDVRGLCEIEMLEMPPVRIESIMLGACGMKSICNRSAESSSLCQFGWLHVFTLDTLAKWGYLSPKKLIDLHAPKLMQNDLCKMIGLDVPLLTHDEAPLTSTTQPCEPHLCFWSPFSTSHAKEESAEI